MRANSRVAELDVWIAIKQRVFEWSDGAARAFDQGNKVFIQNT